MVAIVGAGAFGIALAVALSRDGRPVTLWGRDVRALAEQRQSPRLPGIVLPPQITVYGSSEPVFAADIVLLALPTQQLPAYLQITAHGLARKSLVACCKGIDLTTLTGPTATISAHVPDARAAILTGPSFAADIARGLPTALTLACADGPTGQTLQAALSVPGLRLYRSNDTIGAELGGALKNVIAIACGACIGAGLGDSARAALVTRGFAEMRRLSVALGARPETLAGLSGLGDLVLTCTSGQSRNFAFGLSLGLVQPHDPAITVEGVATAKAVSVLAERLALDLPVMQAVADLITGRHSVVAALSTLLSRPLKEE